MATRLLTDDHFTWGEEVQVHADAPSQYRPLSAGAVCDMWKLRQEDPNRFPNVGVGEQLYLVEFGDGSTAEVPGKWLGRKQGEPLE